MSSFNLVVNGRWQMVVDKQLLCRSQASCQVPKSNQAAIYICSPSSPITRYAWFSLMKSVQPARMLWLNIWVCTQDSVFDMASVLQSSKHGKRKLSLFLAVSIKHHWGKNHPTGLRQYFEELYGSRLIKKNDLQLLLLHQPSMEAALVECFLA